MELSGKCLGTVMLMNCYIAQNADPEILKISASGGVFLALAGAVLASDGVIFGAIYDDHFAVRHEKARDKEKCLSLAGSKYAQSEVGDTFSKIMALIESNIEVLFVGTPCQVAGLNSFLRISGVKESSMQNLYMVDFVCHGVGSPKLLAMYVKEKEQQGITISKICMRSKRYGYRNSTMCLTDTSSRKRYYSPAVDDYLRSFFSNLQLRPSCYCCSFKEIHRLSDMTLYDSWNAESIIGIPPTNRGYTNILMHSEKGQLLLERARDNLNIYEVELSSILPKNRGGNVLNSAKLNPKRSEFYARCNSDGLHEAISVVAPVKKRQIIKEGLKRVLYAAGILDASAQFVRRRKA